MTAQDLSLLTPVLAVAVLAVLVIVLDLAFDRKGALAPVAALGLVAPVALGLDLWSEVHQAPTGEMTGVFGTLVVDKFALFFQFLVLGVTGLVIGASVDYAHRFQRRQGEFYALILFSAAGMMLLVAATELITIYLALELTSLSLAALATFLRDTRSTEAGIKFLLLSALSSAVLLYGMALVYGFTGTTKLEGIAQAVAQGHPDIPFGSYALLAGVVLMVAGFGFKLSIVPFQMWVPDVYEGAPTPITAYLSVASKAAGFAVVLRVFSSAFSLPEVSADWGALFAWLSVLSMTVGNLVAIAQSNIKRMLAYSTIAHAGYILVGMAAIATGAPEQETLGPSGVLFYLGAYAATNLAAFFAVIAMVNKVENESIDALAGMGRRAPVLAAVLAFALVSLIGLPPTGGFIAKLYIFNAAVRSDLVWLALVGMVNSVVSAYYYLRVVRVMYLARASSPEGVPSSRGFRAALGVAALGVLVLGIVPGPLIEVTQTAAGVLLPAG